MVHVFFVCLLVCQFVNLFAGYVECTACLCLQLFNCCRNYRISSLSYFQWHSLKLETFQQSRLVVSCLTCYSLVGLLEAKICNLVMHNSLVPRLVHDSLSFLSRAKIKVGRQVGTGYQAHIYMLLNFLLLPYTLLLLSSQCLQAISHLRLLSDLLWNNIMLLTKQCIATGLDSCLCFTLFFFQFLL